MAVWGLVRDGPVRDVCSSCIIVTQPGGCSGGGNQMYNKPLSPPALFSPANVHVEDKVLGTVASQVNLPGLSIAQGSRQRETKRGTILLKFLKYCSFGVVDDGREFK